MGLVKEAVRAWLAAESNGHQAKPCGCGQHQQQPQQSRRSWDDVQPKKPHIISDDRPPCDHERLRLAIREFQTQVTKEFVIMVFHPNTDIVYGVFVDTNYETARLAAEQFIGEQDLLGVLGGDIHRHNH